MNTKKIYKQENNSRPHTTKCPKKVSEFDGLLRSRKNCLLSTNLIRKRKVLLKFSMGNPVFSNTDIKKKNFTDFIQITNCNEIIFDNSKNHIFHITIIIIIITTIKIEKRCRTFVIHPIIKKMMSKVVLFIDRKKRNS